MQQHWDFTHTHRRVGNTATFHNIQCFVLVSTIQEHRGHSCRHCQTRNGQLNKTETEMFFLIHSYYLSDPILVLTLPTMQLD